MNHLDWKLAAVVIITGTLIAGAVIGGLIVKFGMLII